MMAAHTVEPRQTSEVLLSNEALAARVEVVAIVIAAGLTGCLLMDANWRMLGEAFATADLASDSLRTLDAKSFDRFTGTWPVALFEYPGVFQFYWRAFFEWMIQDVLAIGTAYQATFASHVSFNVGALAWVSIAIARFARGSFVGLLCYAASVAWFSDSFVYLTTLWAPLAAVIPAYACFLSCAFAAAGSFRHWPPAVFLGAVVGGSYLPTMVPVAAALATAWLVFVVLHRGSTFATLRSHKGSLLLSLILGLVVVTPSIIDAAIESPDNVDRIVEALGTSVVSVSGDQMDLLLRPLTAEAFGQQLGSLATLCAGVLLLASIRPRDWLVGRDLGVPLAAVLVSLAVYFSLRLSFESIGALVPTHAGWFLVGLPPLVLSALLYFAAQPSRRIEEYRRSLLALVISLVLLGWTCAFGAWTNLHLVEGSYMNGMERQGLLSSFTTFLLEHTEIGDRVELTYEHDGSEPNRVAVGLADFLRRHGRTVCTADSEFNRLMFAVRASCPVGTIDVRVLTVPEASCDGRCAIVDHAFGLVVSRP